MVPGLLKGYIDGIDGQVKPHVKALIEDQLKEMQSTKVIMTLWVRWKKPVKSALTLESENVEDTKDIEGNTVDSYPVELVYSRPFVMVDTFLWHLLNHGQTLIEKPLHCRHLCSGQLLWRTYFLAPSEFIKPNLPLHSGHPIFFMGK